MLYILIIVIGAIVSYFGPWWLIALVSMGLCAWKAKTSVEGAKISAAAVLSLWVGYATFLNITSDVNLVDKIADLFSGGVGFLSKIPKVGLVFSIIALIASSLGGLSGAAGVKIREFIQKA
jgi:hypothetical protein